MKPWIVVGAVVVLLIAFMAGRSLLRQEGATSGSDEARQTQAAVVDDPVERGRRAYFRHCVACHSPDTDEYIAGIALKDYFNNPPTKLSNGSLFPRTDEAIRDLVENGTKNMPPLMKGISPRELDDILSYMHML